MASFPFRQRFDRTKRQTTRGSLARLFFLGGGNPEQLAGAVGLERPSPGVRNEPFGSLKGNHRGRCIGAHCDLRETVQRFRWTFDVNSSKPEQKVNQLAQVWKSNLQTGREIRSHGQKHLDEAVQIYESQ